MLKRRADYDRVISAYADKVLRKARSARSQIEQDIFRASEVMDDLKQLLSDTLKNKLFALTLGRASRDLSKSLADVRVNQYIETRLIRYYSDSVYKPLVSQYGNNSNLPSLKRIIDFAWWKFYLYSEKNDSALRIATELSKYESPMIDYRLCLVITYLATGRKTNADSLFRSMQPMRSRIKKIQTDRQLYYLLNRLSEKKIALDSIRTFIKQHKLNNYDW